ncbi:hypothetical protein [Candidatus Cyanaurora vandensis]|uniref:hypothetical protein n=1 Tax=Candidatus Cyanaurora vandensis TaxID=2714958 RepID=UPI00257AEAA7|nr:hypothetical protein [Candidatus Cyanaurora vandensis]
MVRFAEVQITQQPTSCCKVIAQTLQDPLLHKPFSHVPDLLPVPHWTQAEAEVMARTGRDVL